MSRRYDLEAYDQSSHDTFHGWKFILSPINWGNAQVPVSLTWCRTKFARANASNVPNDKQGVYAFVAIPEVDHQPTGEYVMYIGRAGDKTSRNTLRARYHTYIQEARRDRKGRPEVQRMFWSLPEHLWFYWAEIDDPLQITECERHLKDWLRPPANNEFETFMSLPAEAEFYASEVEDE